jgi:hypothetical protein
MKGFCGMKMAGMEFTARIRSVVSAGTSATKSGRGDLLAACASGRLPPPH